MIHPRQYYSLLLADAAQSREIDRRTIESLGLPGETLMEVAGIGAAEIISADLPYGSAVLMICGKGNNAGDAFVAARILLDEGYKIALYPVFGTSQFSDDAAKNYTRLMDLAESMNTKVTVWNKWQNPGQYDLVVDALFGTGLERKITEPVSNIIDRINKCHKPVYALDIPSGLHCDTGKAPGKAVHAAKTIQFGLRKLGCYLGDGPGICGDRLWVKLPFPNIYKKDISVRLVDEQHNPYDDLVPSRDRDEPLHKYNNGVVNVIGGSAGLTGAPLYAARAAWSLGMGAVTLIHPHGWLNTMDVQAPELIKKPVGESGSGFFTGKDTDRVLTLINERQGVTVIGPGIGRDPETLTFVRNIINKSEGPVIVDADGLRAIQGNFDIVSKRKQPELVILTPHPGELAFMTGESFRHDSDRLQITIDTARQMGCTILSKGNPVFVHSEMTGQTLITGYDTSVFARAGFGDILAGHIAAFAARRGDALNNCENGLLHGKMKILETISRGIRFPEPSDLI